MGWIGALVGMFAGSVTRIPFGGLLGAIVGSVVEEHLKEKSQLKQMQRNAEESARRRRTRRQESGESRTRREAMFIAAAAAMFAKMAKADGQVTADEIACVERAFSRLGLTGEKREFCIQVFRRAKDDDASIYSYAVEFASCEPQAHVRELMYGLLWDLACSDGVLSSAELDILRRITVHLGVRAMLFEIEYARRVGGRRWRSADEDGSSRSRSDSSRRSSRGTAGAPSELERAYAELGCTASSTDEELKRAYRDLAKKHHPDALRARGVPPELVEKANARMARVNAAWAEIKKARFGR